MGGGMFQGAVREAGSAVGVPVDQHRAFHPGPLAQAHLQLVGHDGRLQPVLQVRDLGGGHVGHAQGTDLALIQEAAHGAGNLGQVHERVGAVQQEHVHVVGAEALQAAVDAGQDVGGS